MDSIRNCVAIFKREIKSYFQAPVAYVFMIVFLVLTGFLTFSVTRFYERQTADLQPFFFWLPWVFLLLVPAATMGLWSEERRAGTIELLLTMPITMFEAIMGKFLAAWLFIALNIGLTFPIIITTCYLGEPDTGAMIAGYLGAIMLAGAYVSVGMLTSSMTRSQVISFVLALVFCLLFVLAGWDPVTGAFSKWAPRLAELVASFSFMTHFESIQRGVIDLRDVVYYASVMTFMLVATHVVLNNRKSA
ncbi:MAG: ABC transporter permease subunit [Kiritimatiellae bacterium]|nr:ABC transporter permease subunit [Kiritimatiellia bacterium]MDD5520099.1 ABC transporter permease subunit [Kiritimatiellia bacterium]